MPARPVWAVPKIAGQKVSQNGKKCLLLFRSCIVKYLCHTTTTPSLRTRQHTWCMRVHRSVFGHDVPPHDARRRTLLAQARTPLSPRLVRIASSLLASRPPSGCGHARSQRQPAHRLTELRGPHAARAASRARARARARSLSQSAHLGHSVESEAGGARPVSRNSTKLSKCTSSTVPTVYRCRSSSNHGAVSPTAFLMSCRRAHGR